LAELSLSFPALLVALAYGRAGVDRHRLMEMAIQGAPLPILAKQAGVPLWLRRMPPDLLAAPLPELPDSLFLRHRMVNHFPRHPRQSTQWLGAVSEGGLWVHDEFALWCARNFAVSVVKQRRGRRRSARSAFHILCLWAWYSSQPHTRAHGLITVPWSPDMQRPAAFTAAFEWRDSVELDLTLGAQNIDDWWLQPGSVDGYAFQPLRTAADIDAEGRAMRNCVRTYGDAVASGDARLWSVRRNGGRFATLEIGRTGKSPVPSIRQLCLAGNEEAPADLWLSAHRWFNAQGLIQLPEPESPNNRSSFDVVVWRQLWKPFWLAKRRIPDWLPLAPSWDILYCA
jgi:hypothetical protein